MPEIMKLVDERKMKKQQKSKQRQKRGWVNRSYMERVSAK